MSSKRTDWVFRFPTGDVLKATTRKSTHHMGRLSHWQDEERKAQEELKEHGIDWREAVTPGYSNSTAYVQQPTFDGRLLKRLQECQERVRYHQTHVDAYEQWRAALKVADEKTLELTFDDVVFFDMPGLAKDLEAVA